MEAAKDVIAYISNEWTVIGSAPVTFITVVVLAGVGIWFITRFIQRGEIAGLKATINTQNQRIDLSKERLEHSQEQLAELERELEKTEEAIPADSAAKEHSLAASAIASGVRTDLEKTADALTLPAHLVAASGTVEPVWFVGMDGKKKGGR